MAIAASFSLAVILTVTVRALARRFGVVARPKADRWHTKPTALMGGVSIAVTTSIIGFWLVPQTDRSMVVLSSSLLMFLIGFVDDLVTLKPYQKVIGQLVAASAIISYGMYLPWTGYYPINVLITLFWLVGITNAVNLLDNMDGLSAGATAIAAVSFFTIAAMNGQILVGSLAIALAGACLGFLRYNFNPATVFMGDTGTLFMGFLLAVIGMKLKATGPAWWSFIVAIAVLALPIFDTSLVTVYRLWKRQAVSQGGKDHTSHRLVKLGLPKSQAVLVLYGASAVAGAVALAMARSGVDAGIVYGLPVVVGALGAGLFLARVDV